MDRRPCVVHTRHVPHVVTTHDHHIVPRGMGGPDEPENMVTVCPTGHFNIHARLAALIFGGPLPDVTDEEARLAGLGFSRWVAAGKPGNARAAYG